MSDDTCTLEGSKPTPDDAICDLGYICDYENETLIQPLRKYSCDQLRQDVIDEDYGDLLAGIYCKNGTLEEGGALISNCPAGYYCPNSTTQIICPAGYYCPTKSADFRQYECVGCKEGSTRFNVNVPVLVTMILLTVVLPSIAYLAWKFMLTRKEVSKSKLSRSGPSFRTVQKMKAKLMEIDERLGTAFVNKLDKTGNIIGYDSDKLFDAIDENGDEEIEYDELDKAMALTGDQLTVFISKMNQAAGNPDNCTTVSRETFVKYFFETIISASNFDPSPADAKLIFDSVPQSGNSDCIELEALHHSSLATFLSEKQIVVLRRLFRARLGKNGNVNHLGKYGEVLITKQQFVSLYPSLLHELIRENEEKCQPFDIHFEKLSLKVPVKGGKEKTVVNDVSGRIQAGTMTALMGGSGAGKTSLLNTLCGRAHYGNPSGTIHVNGKEIRIERCRDSISFVPQDDIVYAELTVRENFLFAGKIRLPKGTSKSYIEDLADGVIADLGLTRVASSIVGDVTRRGVSGGEKKRVNIGLELMSKPSVLFLDEPTSGLDSSSAMIVMASLANLVRTQGMTVCAVIHQPRKQIYEMFDTLVLLGVGGNLVYHGSASGAEKYFLDLGYELQSGEALADWMIDISSGELSPSLPSNIVESDNETTSGTAKTFAEETEKTNDETNDETNEDSPEPLSDEETGVPGTRPDTAPIVAIAAKETKDQKVGVSFIGGGTNPVTISRIAEDGLFASSDLKIGMQILAVNNVSVEGMTTVEAIHLVREAEGELILVACEGLPTEECNTITTGQNETMMGTESDQKAGDVISERLLQQGDRELSAAANREMLYKEWIQHYNGLQGEDKTFFTKPSPSSLPDQREAPDFFVQVWNQMKRQWILLNRNLVFKLVDTLFIVAATALIALVEKPLELTVDVDPKIPNEYYALTSVGENPGNFEFAIPFLFKHATEKGEKIIAYGNKLSVLIAVLSTLSTAKVLTDKRVEFFREAASGYNINAYFLAVNIFNAIETALKMIIASLFAYALRNTAAKPGNVVLQFILLGWTASAWGLLIPLLVSPQSTVIVCAFVSLIANLLLGGSAGGMITYEDIYGNSTISGVISGLLAPSRFFIESTAVNEFRTLEIQHGFTGYTMLDEGYDGATGKFLSNGFNSTSLGMHDPSVSEESMAGWAWGVLPALLVGLTIRLAAFLVLQLRNRKQMLKTPIKSETRGVKWKMFILFLAFAAGLGLSIYSFTNDYTWNDQCKAAIGGDDYDESLLDDYECDEEMNVKMCKYDSCRCLWENNRNRQKEKIQMKYPNCEVEHDFYYSDFGDKTCDSSFNSPQCGFDDGDCFDFNAKYPDCDGYPRYVGDGTCHYSTNNEQCGWDGGDCTPRDYPDCLGIDPDYLGESWTCSDASYNNANCGWSDGACIHPEYPDCLGIDPDYLGESWTCSDASYNNANCGWSDGACIHPEYPDCLGIVPDYLYSPYCKGGQLNTAVCGYQNGHCDVENEMIWELWPECDGGVYPDLFLDDDVCHLIGPHNTAACGYDNGACLQFNEQYPMLANCTSEGPAYKLLNDVCDGGKYNTKECLYDFGACIEYNNNFPDCNAEYPAWVGDGYCSDDLNRPECGWDGKDCIHPDYPECLGIDPNDLGNGICQDSFNRPECGFDDGDCALFNSYPNCDATDPSYIGDGTCGQQHNTEDCGWDGNDCAAFNTLYPNCTFYDPELIGDGTCHDSVWGANVEECGWDGGDCLPATTP